MTIELHGFHTGNCLRVAVALEEAELPYAVHNVNLAAGDHYRPGHLALNPHGKVPVIVDRSDHPPFVLTQSNAIMMYIDQKAPGRILPIAPKERAIAIERLFYFVTDVIAPGMSAFRVRGSEDAQASLLHSALEAWSDSSRFLENSRYMAGDTFSAADIAAGVFIQSYRRHVDWSTVPTLERWLTDVMARPSFQKGLQAFG